MLPVCQRLQLHRQRLLRLDVLHGTTTQACMSAHSAFAVRDAAADGNQTNLSRELHCYVGSSRSDMRSTEEPPWADAHQGTRKEVHARNLTRNEITKCEIDVSAERTYMRGLQQICATRQLFDRDAVVIIQPCASLTVKRYLAAVAAVRPLCVVLPGDTLEVVSCGRQCSVAVDRQVQLVHRKPARRILLGIVSARVAPHAAQGKSCNRKQQ